MKKLSVIVPCYNEAENIPLIIADFKRAATERDDVEIILVNNGSSDDSSVVLERELKKERSDFFRVVNVEKNQGYGFGILAGLEVASADTLAWTHADMQTDPADVFRGFELYQKENNDKIFVKGKRRNRALAEYLLTFAMQSFASTMLKIFLNDINAQPKIFSKNFYYSFLKDKAPNDFSLDLFALYQAKKNNFLIKEVDVYFKKRLYGEAKGGAGSWRVRIKVIRRTVSYILKLRKSV